MPKPIVFISHISEERELAVALKALIEKSFLGMMVTFVSSDPKSIELGQQWLDQIKSNLSSCVIEVVIASPASLKRHWINFEAGAGWIRGIPVVPVCHSGMTPTLLPNPLVTFQAMMATNADSLNNLLHVLAKALDSTVPENADFSGFIEEVAKYEKETKDREKLRIKDPNSEIEGLLPYEMQVLATIANLTYHHNEPTELNYVRKSLPDKFSSFLFPLALRMLERHDFISTYVERIDYDDHTYQIKITEPGWSWISQHKEEVWNVSAPLVSKTGPLPQQNTNTSADDDIPF